MGGSEAIGGVAHMVGLSAQRSRNCVYSPLEALRVVQSTHNPQSILLCASLQPPPHSPSSRLLNPAQGGILERPPGRLSPEREAAATETLTPPTAFLSL
jgi:hypothetical protein